MSNVGFSLAPAQSDPVILDTYCWGTCIECVAQDGESSDGSGMCLVFEDEFDDPEYTWKTWTKTVSPWPFNEEKQYYVNSSRNSFLEDGRLVIRALNEVRITYFWLDLVQQILHAALYGI